jgi:hypothetical protein
MTHDELTANCQTNGFSTAGLLTALEAGWAAIRDRNPQVPEVVIVVGSGSPARASGTMKWGHFASSQWQHRGTRVPEVLVSGEGLARTPAEVFTTLLHEATHGLAFARSIVDTSRQGRYHNKHFATLAAELGLLASKTDKFGWTSCTLNEVTAVWYAESLTRLEQAMSAYRHPDTVETSAGAKTGNGVVLECDCPRKIRASVAVAELGPIHCGVCDGPFVAEVS